MKNKLNKRLLLKALSITIIVIIFVACGFELLNDHGSYFDDEYKNIKSPVVYNTSSVKAGEYANFTFYVKALANEEKTDKLIIAFQVPKSWTEAKNAEVTWELWNDIGELRPMELLSTSPKNKPGLTWDQALLNTVGGRTTNVLDDMQWYAFQAKSSWTIYNQIDLFIKVRIKVKTGPDNLRAKIGFFVNHADDGLGTDEDRWKVIWGDCFDVTDGEGDIIDFCEYHFNRASPGMATQNDILTFEYIGDYYTNDLMTEENNIYINAKAITDKGNTYTVDEISDKTKMKKSSEYGIAYSKTFWSEAYFNIPEGETITSIKYYFTNSDKTKYVSDYDEQHKDEVAQNPNQPGKPIEPFIYNFICK